MVPFCRPANRKRDECFRHNTGQPSGFWCVNRHCAAVSTLPYTRILKVKKKTAAQTNVINEIRLRWQTSFFFSGRDLTVHFGAKLCLGAASLSFHVWYPIPAVRNLFVFFSMTNANCHLYLSVWEENVKQEWKWQTRVCWIAENLFSFLFVTVGCFLFSLGPDR